MHLDDFHDGVLLRLLRFLTPLPDLYNVARVSKRFHNLANDPRLWLVVSQDVDRGQEAAMEFCARFTTLSAAVTASRPGDTVFIQPGAHVANNVVIKWPLHMIGGGQTPIDNTQLQCLGGASDTAVEFWASSRMTNLSIHARALASCVRHHSGSLLVEKCILRCDGDHPLKHLCSPITMGTDRGVEAGKVSVMETSIEGGCKAFDGETVQDVRVIYNTLGCLYWFTVLRQWRHACDLTTSTELAAH